MLHIPAEDEARKAIRILNPISENLSIMRTLLTPSMLNVIVDNLKKGNARVACSRWHRSIWPRNCLSMSTPTSVRLSASVPSAPRRTSSPSRARWKHWQPVLA